MYTMYHCIIYMFIIYYICMYIYIYQLPNMEKQ